MTKKDIIIVLTILLFGNFAMADCPLAHTHIGKNPTWRPDWSDPGNPDKVTDTDLTDDNKLWFFSLPPILPAGTPGWPNWEQANGDTFLRLVPELESGNPIMKPGESGKQLWTCRFTYSKANGYDDPAGVQHLDGWHSAHGPQGAWNLESIDEQTEPGWDIRLKREGVSVDEDDFFMLLPDGTAVLTTNGSVYSLSKQWLGDKNAWGFHEHMGFYFWLTPVLGQEVSVTFSAFDSGGMYTASDDFQMTFVTVPEPMTLSFLALGGAGLLRRRHP